MHSISLSDEELRLTAHALREQSFKIRERAIDFASSSLIDEANQLSALSDLMYSKTKPITQTSPC